MRVHFVCVSDEESEEHEQRGSDYLVEHGYIGDFAITGEPTDLHIGVQAKGVLAHAHRGDRPLRARLDALGRATTRCSRRSTSSAHRVAAVRARVVRPVRPALDQPRPDPRRRRAQQGARRRARSTSTSATCPARTPRRSCQAIRELPDAEVVKVFHRGPVDRRPRQPVRAGARRGDLARGAAATASRSRSGRDGASDAICFLDAGVPAVEFGPVGDGHHGPEEWVSIQSLGHYRRALVEFVDLLPARLGQDERRLRIA